MAQKNLDFFFVNSTDKYLNEYNNLENNSRYLITGFTGSTGEALVHKDKAYLFVDGRYHKQADDEVDHSLVSVYKLKLAQAQREGIVETIKDNASNKVRIGIVSSKVGVYFYEKLIEGLQGLDFEIIEYSKDPIKNIVDFSASKESYSIRKVPIHISGMGIEKKLSHLSQKMHDTDIFVITKLEEIAYLTNLRSNQILFNSSFGARAVFDKEKLYIFCNTNHIDQDIIDFCGTNIVFKEEDDFEEFIPSTYNEQNIALVKKSASLDILRVLEKTNNNIIELASSPIAEMKSIKNRQELVHIIESFYKTDNVVQETISWLNNRIDKDINTSEKDVAKKVKELFKEQGAISLSFDVLLSSGQNTAIIHYTHPDPNKFIQKGELVLLDCGGYFEGGYATDITRTWIAGNNAIATDEQKRVYTTVLKAHLRALNLNITPDTTGFDIDKAARDIINKENIENFSFAHGTGHGVGISVHEFPPGVSSSELSKQPLVAGMCFTIEPGLYNNNWGGVRLENTVALLDEEGELKIESLSKVPFDEKLIDFPMLDDKEKKWLEIFQASIES